MYEMQDLHQGGQYWFTLGLHGLCLHIHVHLAALLYDTITCNIPKKVPKHIMILFMIICCIQMPYNMCCAFRKLPVFIFAHIKAKYSHIELLIIALDTLYMISILFSSFLNLHKGENTNWSPSRTTNANDFFRRIATGVNLFPHVHQKNY